MVASDSASSAWAWSFVPADGTGAVFGLSLSRVDNRGAAFGLGAARPLLVLLAALAAVSTVSVWAGRSRRGVQRLGLSLALGGGLGSLFVRLVHGAVIDSIHLAPYPATFNRADLAIRGGLLLVPAEAQTEAVRHKSRSRRGNSTARDGHRRPTGFPS